MCAIYLNRQIVLNVINYLPLAFLLVFAEHAYIALGLDPLVAKEAQSFVLLSLPGLLFLSISNCLTRYLSGQREVRFSMYTNLITFVLHIFIAYYLAVNQALKLQGIAIANTLHYLLRFLVLLVIMRCSRFWERLVPLSDKESFKGLGGQFRLGI